MNPTRRAAVLVCLATVPTGFTVIAALWAVAHHDYDRAQLFTALSTCWAVTGFTFAINLGGHLPPQIETDERGTSFRPAHRIASLQLLVISTSLAFVLVLLGASPFWVGKLASEFEGVTRPLMLIAGVVCAVAPVVALTVLMWTWFRWHGLVYLRLTQDEVFMSVGPWLRVVPWDEVADVADGGASPRGYGRSVLVLITADGHKHRLPAGLFAPGGQALKDLVGFYWRNRDFHDELTNGAAAGRFTESLSRARI